MTFQFIIKYINPKYNLPFGLGYIVDELVDFDGCIKTKRVRAKNGEQAIKIFKKKHPELEIIGWRYQS